MKIAATLSVAIAATAASIASAQTVISEVAVGTAQYVAGMRNTADAKTICTGTLIHPKWVLTTAHLANGLEWVNVGTHFQSGAADGTAVKVLRKIRHPRFYSAGVNYDFLLVELEKEVPYKPVALAAADEPAGVKATTRGWGVTAQDADGSKVLRQVDVSVISKEECDKGRLQSPGVMCTVATLPNASCQGSTGDPLLVNKNGTDVQVGMMSGSRGCWQNRAEYVRVSEARPFIDQYVKQVRWV